MNQHKQRSTEFPCLECEKKFALKCLLDQHIKSCHLFLPSTCEFCGKLFDNPRKLKSHTAFVHGGKVRKKPEVDRSDWTCPICSSVVMAYKKSDHLKSHQEPKYTCDICGKKLKKKTSFDQHMNQHLSILDFKCEPCNKVILAFYSLLRNNENFSGICVQSCAISTYETVCCSSKREN